MLLEVWSMHNRYRYLCQQHRFTKTCADLGSEWKQKIPSISVFMHGTSLLLPTPKLLKNGNPYLKYLLNYTFAAVNSLLASNQLARDSLAQTHHTLSLACQQSHVSFPWGGRRRSESSEHGWSSKSSVFCSPLTTTALADSLQSKTS